MKILLSEVRSAIRSLLRESVCPGCGNPQAYIGGVNNVECPNPTCKFFSLKQAELEKPPASAEYPEQRYKKLCPCENDLIIGSPQEGYQCDRCGRDFDQEEFEQLDDVVDEDDDEEESFERELEWFDVEQSFPRAAEEWAGMGTGSAKHDDFWEDGDGDLCARPLGSKDEYVWDPQGEVWGRITSRGKTTTILGPPVKF